MRPRFWMLLACALGLFAVACAPVHVRVDGNLGDRPDASRTPGPAGPAIAPARDQVGRLRITILSTMLAGNPLFKGIGEWGFAALVEADGRLFLFDTGLRPTTVLHNAKELGIDLSSVTDLVISHHHEDHVGGLLELRRAFVAVNSACLSRVHAAEGVFASRGTDGGGKDENPMIAIRAAYEATGGEVMTYAEPALLAPGVWLTGPVPRPHPERNWGGSGRVMMPGGWTEDNVPEDASLVFDTERGLVVLSGCGHAGIVNTLEFAREKVRASPIVAAVGGFHLFAASEEGLAWTAEKLREFGLGAFLGAHCTGIEATWQLRDRVGLSRETAVVGAVGASYDLESGIQPLLIAK